MQLNHYFISNIQTIYGQAGTRWLKELPIYIDSLSREWNFHFLKPMTDLSYNFVGLVKMEFSGNTAIIKIAPTQASLSNEVRWLNCIESGTPKVLAFNEKLNAFLMEHLEPGSSLKNLVKIGKDDAATRIICQTIRHLQSQQHVEYQFKHLSELPEALSILKNRYDAKLLSQAESWFHDLTMDRSNDVILHGDLHHDNILSSGLEWKAIDPHGYLGDPAAEVGAMIRNPFDCFPTDRPLSKVIERRLDIMAEELPFDPQRIKCWAFCMTVLSDAWTLEGHPNANEGDLDIEVAAAIDKTAISID